MSAQLRNLNPLMQDKEFVKNYFRGVKDGNDVTRRLTKDGATINSPDLIARLVGWLEEAEPSDASSSDAVAQAEQQVNSLNLASKEEEREKEKKEEEKASAQSTGVITGDKTTDASGQDKASTPGGQSSDGTTRTSSASSSPTSSGKTGPSR